jgi:aconitate hydratase
MTVLQARNSFDARDRLELSSGPCGYYRLDRLAELGMANLQRLPFSIRILLESLLRNEDGRIVTREMIAAFANYDPARPPKLEIPFLPARVLLQDFTGVPCLVDLAAMRSALRRAGGDPARINPRIPVDLVIDHSVQVDRFAAPEALAHNARLEFDRNRERYEFLHWGQQAFRNMRVVPPASGICHQVNLESLAAVVQRREHPGEDLPLLYPDTLVGTDSHTPMVNGLGVLGWGVGGIEAEAAMLGQPLHMLAPAVVGVRLTGGLPAGATATDLVLTLTQLLRARGVVGKIVEYCGPGLEQMTVADRATISNMAPEYGATAGFFPVDRQSLRYLHGTGRPAELVEWVEAYCRAQGLLRTPETPDPAFAERVELDLGTVVPSLAGPKRPQDRVALPAMKAEWKRVLHAPHTEGGFGVADGGQRVTVRVAAGVDEDYPAGFEAAITHGTVAIAAITSCTNTSNPSVMLGAGLLARKAVAAGLTRQPWVKTSLAPGSKVVTRYLEKAGLLAPLEALGFHIVGYGCTTCIGNSGPMPAPLARAVDQEGLVLAAVLSGNRNFEGRINPKAQASYLASPPLVVAYALAGRVDIDFASEPLGQRPDGGPVYLRDIWPDGEELAQLVDSVLTPEMFAAEYADIESSNQEWNRIRRAGGAVYAWNPESTYIQEPPFFAGLSAEPPPMAPIRDARVLVMAGDSTTTDHISPAGAIAAESPAGRYLQEQGVAVIDFNSYGSRRGNDRVMTRGTFANIRFRNRLAPGTEGGWTRHMPSGELMSIHAASQRYRQEGVALIVLGGRDYGMGSSRDWAAKGTQLLGARAVIAESFERIHRSNLVGMGVLPLQYREGEDAASLGLTGQESYTIDVDDAVSPGDELAVTAVSPEGEATAFRVICRLDTPIDVVYYRNGGILQTVLRGFLREG